MIKVRIQNYEIVEDAKILIDGLTAFVGQSNNGKSSLYRAIKTLVYNMSGTSYIRQESNGKQSPTGVVVGMQIDNSDNTVSKIIFSKIKSPQYSFNNNVYEKVGKGMPEDLATYLNMSPVMIEDKKVLLNFSDQFNPPLLMSLTESQLFNIVIKTLDGEKINEAIKVAKKDIDDLNKEIERKEIATNLVKTDIFNINYFLNKSADLIKIKKDYKNYIFISNNIDKLKDLNISRGSTFKLKDKLFEQILVLSKCDKINEALDKAKVVDSTIKSIKILLLAKREKNINLKDYTSKVELYRKCNNIFLDCEEIKTVNYNLLLAKRFLSNKIKNLQEIELLNNKIKTFNSKDGKLVLSFSLNELGFKLLKLKEFKNTRDNISKKISEFKIHLHDQDELNQLQNLADNKLCPLCKKKLNKNEQYMLAEVIEKIEVLKNKKNSLESQVQLLTTQLSEIDSSIKKAGYDPEKLEEEIKKQEKEIETFEKKALTLIEKLNSDLSSLESSKKDQDNEFNLPE